MMDQIRSIQMKFCRVDYRLGTDPFVVTHFVDGSSYGAVPAETKEYKFLAARCGYDFGIFVPHIEIWRYCLEHEVAHSVVAEHIYGEPSRVIYGCAHGNYADPVDILHEEEMAITLQSFARNGKLPGSSAPGFSWFDLRTIFVNLMDGPHA